MKQSRFTEEQIIGILKEHGEACQRHWFERHAERRFRCRSVPQAWRQRCDRLQMEGQVWRHGGQRGQAAEGPGGGELQAEAAYGWPWDERGWSVKQTIRGIVCSEQRRVGFWVVAG